MASRPLSAFICAITPFDENDKVDEDAIRVVFGRLSGTGVGAFVGTASPGEGQALTLQETEVLYGVAKETLGGTEQVRAMGREPRTARELLEIVRIAENVGLDAMQLYSLDLGHSLKPTEDELERYFRTLLEQMTIPAVLSSHMMSGGYVIPVDMFARLLDEYPQIIGINVTTPDLAYLARIIDTADGRADVHVGGPQQAFNALSLGAQGFLTSEGIIAPQLVGAVIDSFRAGDLAAMATANGQLQRLALPRLPGDSMRFIKASLRVLGFPGWHMRAPFLPLDDDAHARIAAHLRSLGIPELESLLPGSVATASAPEGEHGPARSE